MRLCEYDYMEETHLIMGTTSQYCLRWNNHQTNLLSAFDTLLRQESFTDVTLACEEGITLQAHRLVLAACSSYFSNLFSITASSQHPIVILKDVRASEMKALMHYMYRGEVNVEQSQLKELLKVAEGLRVKGLVEDLASDTQTHPLPLITSDTQPLPLLVTPSQRYTPGVSPSPTPVDSRTTPNNCSEGWEPESFYTNNIRRAFHSPPSSPFKRSKPDIKEEPGLIREHSPPNRNTNPYFQPYLSQHINMNHSQRLPHPSFDSKDHKPLKESYDMNHIDRPPRSPSNEVRDHKSPSISQPTTPFSVSGQDSPSLKRPRQFAEQPLISPTPILRTALAHARPFQPDVTSLVSLANSMIPLPPLLSARTQSIATTEELRRASDSHRDSFEQKYISHVSKKSDVLSDEDSKTFIDIVRDEEAQEKINNGPVISDFPPYLDPTNPSHFSNFVSYVPTPKPEWKRYKQYTKADLMQAIDAVRKGMTALQASRKYKVPSRTLYDKIKKMGINTIPRRLPSKRTNATDIESSDLSSLHLRQTSGYLEGRSSRSEFFTERASSEEPREHQPVQNIHIQASLTSKEETMEKPELSEDCRSQVDPVIEASTHGSFSLVGTKVFSEDDSGPLDLTDTEGHIPTRPTIQERA